MRNLLLTFVLLFSAYAIKAQDSLQTDTDNQKQIKEVITSKSGQKVVYQLDENNAALQKVFKTINEKELSAEKLEKIRKTIEAKGGTMTVTRPNEKKPVHPFIARWTGRELPPFALKDINGKLVDSKTFAGKVVHINFWSTSCRPCIEEFAEMNELRAKYGDDLIYIAIAPESATLVSKILKKHPLDYTVIADAEELFTQLGIEGYPKNFFIDSEQVITTVTDGTNYIMKKVNGKLRLVPDNFKHYDGILQGMVE